MLCQQLQLTKKSNDILIFNVKIYQQKKSNNGVQGSYGFKFFKRKRKSHVYIACP